MSVYFIQEDSPEGYIKIGFTDGVEHSRLSDLQVGNPRKLAVVAFIPEATRSDELRIQKTFIHEWVRGEWYNPSGDLLSFMEQYAVAPEPVEEEVRITGKTLEASLDVSDWLRLVTFDISKYAKLGGRISISSDERGDVKVTFDDVTADDERLHKKFLKMAAAMTEPEPEPAMMAELT